MMIYVTTHAIHLTIDCFRKGDAVADSSAPAVHHVLDCTGLQCPLPVIKTSQAIKKIELGQILQLLATDPGVEPDMHAWTERTGNELVGISQDNGVYHVLIRRGK